MGIEVRLRAAGRAVDPAEFAEPSGELAQEIVAAGGSRFAGSRRRRLIAFGAVGAVLVPGVAVAATVYHFAAESGQYGAPGATENDTSQYINMCASDIRSYVASLAGSPRPLPAGTSWDQIIDQVATPPAGSCPPVGPGEVEQVTGLKSRLLLATECPWEGDFLRAHAAGDAGEVHRAGQAIASAEDAVAALGVEGDDGWKVLRDGAADGDVAVVQQDYRANCTSVPSTGKAPK